MKNFRCWMVFLACAFGWLLAAFSIAPSMSGVDVFIFRDAGWNLASTGSFESASLIYMRDLTPRLYSHYPPIMPLLFAGYASVFPRNAYTGTFFNFLMGLLAASVALFWLLRQAPDRLRNLAALAIAILPVAFITQDRPEALALVFFAAALSVTARPTSRPTAIGALIALCFLAHPFAAVASGIWAAALFLRRNWDRPNRLSKSIFQTALTAGTTALLLIPVALLYYALDHTSLARFAAHSLGFKSGMGVVIASSSHHTFFESLRFAAYDFGSVIPWCYLLTLCCILLPGCWAMLSFKRLTVSEWPLVAASLCSAAFCLLLFPIQPYYLQLLTFLIPVGLLICGRPSGSLAGIACAQLLFAMAINLLTVGSDFAVRIEQRPSYEASRSQARFLASQLPSPDLIVALEGGSYDAFKPEFRHLIRVDESEDVDRYSKVAAIANCYVGFTGPESGVRPLPEKLNATEFHLIQTAPQHLWITLFGRRLMRSQRGYGCDLYLRNGLGSPAGLPHS
jgi:hypothetical protein